jgi:hypothetical protein
MILYCVRCILSLWHHAHAFPPSELRSKQSESDNTQLNLHLQF